MNVRISNFTMYGPVAFSEVPRALTQEEEIEHQSYLQQDRFRAEERKRQADLDAKIVQLQLDHRKEEFKIYKDQYLMHANAIVSKGIKETRARFVPAYCFERFLELPLELQLRIWSMAARADPSKTHTIVDMRSERKYNYRLGRSHYTREGSSRVVLNNGHGLPRVHHASPMLRVCRNSRKIALEVFTHLSCRDFDGDYILREKEYVNTLYDRFYIGGEPWDKFKILVDLTIKLNTTRPLQPRVQRDLTDLLRIKSLIVDFHIFAEAPKRIWAEFTKLDHLTISFYPLDVISGRELPYLDRPAFRPQFVEPSRKSPYKKRADWIIEKATSALSALKKEVPGYQLPKIDALVRLTEDIDIDFDVASRAPDADWTFDFDPLRWEAEDEDVDDSVWYEDATDWLGKTVEKDRISKLKHKFHPSVRKDTSRILRSGIKFSATGWVTDSEADNFPEPWLSSDSDEWGEDW